MYRDLWFEFSNPPPTIVGTGLVALDVVWDLRDAASAPQFCAGGTCGNVMIILSNFGWRSLPIARLSHDAAGHHVIRDLRRWGVSLEFVHLPPTQATPIYIQHVRRDFSGIPTHTFLRICPLCGRRLPGFRPVTLAAIRNVMEPMGEPSVVFFDRVSPGSLAVAKGSRQRGALVVFEPSGIRDERLFREALSLAHVIKYSHERIEQLTEADVAEESRPLLEIQTLGRDGLRYRTTLGSAKGRVWKELSSFQVMHVSDSAGAGDWCTAGIIHALGQKGYQGFLRTTTEELEAALLFGQALAAWSCGFVGARGGMYTHDRRAIERVVRRIMEEGCGPTLNLATQDRPGPDPCDDACLACGAR